MFEGGEGMEVEVEAEVEAEIEVEIEVEVEVGVEVEEGVVGEVRGAEMRWTGRLVKCVID